MKKNIAFLFTRSLLLTLAMVSLAGAEDTPQLQQINHTILSPNSEQIVLKLSGSYSPKTFTLKDQSPRVVLDFDDMTQGKGVRNLLTTDGPLLKGVRVGVHREGDPKTRVVVDLKSFKGVNYTQQFDEKTSTLTLRFTGPEKREAKESAKPATAPQEKQMKAAATAEATTPEPASPPVAEQPATPPVTPEAVPPPPPAKETATKEAKASKKAEKATASAPAPETKAEAVVTAEKATTPPAPATTPAEPQPPAAMTPPPPQAAMPPAAPAPPAVPVAKEPAPQVTKEPPPTPAKETKESKEAKGVKKEEAKKGEEKTAPAKDPAASSETKPAPTEPTPAEAKQPADQTPPALAAAAEPELESIKFDPSSPKGEMIMFKLNGFHPPAVHGVEEGIPRVICDFNNTKLGSATKKQIKANGQHVKVIRTSVTKKPEKVRVVIDLEPNRSYDLQQVFFKDDNLFVIIVNTIGK